MNVECLLSNTNINIITADVIKYTLDCSSEYRYGAVSPYLCVLGVEVIITGGTPDAFIAEFHPARAVGTTGQPGLQWQLRGTGEVIITGGTPDAYILSSTRPELLVPPASRASSGS